MLVMYSENRCRISSKFIWIRKPRLSSPVVVLRVESATRESMRVFLVEWMSSNKHLRTVSIDCSFRFGSIVVSKRKSTVKDISMPILKRINLSCCLFWYSIGTILVMKSSNKTSKPLFCGSNQEITVKEVKQTSISSFFFVIFRPKRLITF